MQQLTKQVLAPILAILLIGNALVILAQRPYRVNDRQVEQIITRI